MIIRRKTRKIHIGNVSVGGDAPVSIQSMTNTSTADVYATVEQIAMLADVGCEIVRLGIPDREAAEAIAEIKSKSRLPLIADIHFDHRLALIAIENGIDGLRINPGNIKGRDKVKLMVEACKQRNIPIRIGVNAGSLDRKKYGEPTPHSMVVSAMDHIRILEDLNFEQFKISLKSSDVKTMIEANRLFAQKTDYPLHLGVTEAGDYGQAVVKNSIGIGTLLVDGIGDTIRVSITGDVIQEVEAAKMIMLSTGIRKKGVEIVSCPTCARVEFDVDATVKKFREMTRNYPDYIKVAIMGCVVNGPGESKDSDLGLTVSRDKAMIFRGGEVIRRVEIPVMFDVLLEEMRNLNKNS